MDLSIIIPLYHKAEDAAEHLPAVYPALKSKYSCFEIIFIIDNSSVTDNVAAVYKLQEQYKEISVHRLNKNYGQHFATLCGYSLAKGDIICSIDEDMTQYLNIADYTLLHNQYDALYYYYNKNKMYNSFTRKILSASFKLVVHKILNIEAHSTFRFLNRTLVEKLLNTKHIFWNVDVMIYKNAENIKIEYIALDGITDDNSGYNIPKLFRFAFEIVSEHITVLAGFCVGLIPAFIYFLFSRNIQQTTLVYAATVSVLIGIGFTVKKLTLRTKDKIREALSLHAGINSAA